jgi:hypothetical protein
MIKIVFITVRYHYSPSITIPSKAHFLASFLVSDVGVGSKCIQFFLERFEKPEYDAASMNATQYTNENGIVTFTFEPEDEDEGIKAGRYFQIEAKTVAQVLRGWAQVVKEKPQSIEITIDGDDVKVIGVGKRAE